MVRGFLRKLSPALGTHTGTTAYSSKVYLLAGIEAQVFGDRAELFEAGVDDLPGSFF